MIPQVGGFWGCYPDNHRNNWRCARTVPALCENAPIGIGLVIKAVQFVWKCLQNPQKVLTVAKKNPSRVYLTVLISPAWYYLVLLSLLSASPNSDDQVSPCAVSASLVCLQRHIHSGSKTLC